MKQQHTTPCRECPWRKKSVPGWLGSSVLPEEWIAAAHGEELIPCHRSLNMQCAGAAIYRANVLKQPRSPVILVLPRNAAVFQSAKEFIAHHRKHTPSSEIGLSKDDIERRISIFRELYLR